MDNLLLTSFALTDPWRYLWPALVVAALALIIFEVRRLLSWMESEIGALRERRRVGRGGTRVPAAISRTDATVLGGSFPPRRESGRGEPTPSAVEPLRPGPAVERALAARAVGAAAAGRPGVEPARSPTRREPSTPPLESQSMLELLAAALLILVVITSFRGTGKAPRRQG